jgi:hypothetical protein
MNFNQKQTIFGGKSASIRPKYIQNLKDILKDKDKLRKISERAFQEIDTDH